MTSRVQVGVRHILPVFPASAILGGSVFAGTERRPRLGSVLAVALLGWHVAESIGAHPNYVAYFNPAVRSRDYFLLSDSNLSWGQDHARLLEWVSARPVGSVHIVGGEGIGLLRMAGWRNGDESAEHLVVDTNIASLVLADHPGSPLAAAVAREPDLRIGRSFLVYIRAAATAPPTAPSGASPTEPNGL